MHTYTKKEISVLYRMWKIRNIPKTWFRIGATTLETVKLLSEDILNCPGFDEPDFNYFEKIMHALYTDELIKMPLYINLDKDDFLLRDVALWRIKMGK